MNVCTSWRSYAPIGDREKWVRGNTIGPQALLDIGLVSDAVRIGRFRVGIQELAAEAGAKFIDQPGTNCIGVSNGNDFVLEINRIL